MHNTTRLSVGVLLATGVPMGLWAQSARTPKPQGLAKPLTGACAALSNTPSDLVRTPEGMAVLRLKRELDGAAMVFVQKGMPSEGADARRMMEMQRGVDSLMQVIVRTRGADGPGEHTVILRRGDSVATVRTRTPDGRVIEGRPLEGRLPFEVVEGSPNKGVEVFLRTIEPQVKEFSAATARVVANASPTGYLGVNMSGSQVRNVSDSGAFTAHCDYPVIESVELGSPARAAGLEAGDTIIAYNGRDVVAQVVNYPQLLVPGKVLKVRVRHDGKSREVPVTVAERPRDHAESFVFRMQSPSPRVVEGRPLMSGNSVFVTSSSGTPTPAMIAGNASTASVLGAQLNAIDDEFAQSLGLEPGLLVMRVQSGSPVAEAGVRVGEVIRALNGAPVRELEPLLRAVRAPGVHEVRLTVVARAASPRTVVVKF
jgi:serine protease Do